MHAQSAKTIEQSKRRGSSPQVRIYNRYFYKKENQQALLQQQQLRQIKMIANIPKITPSSYAILSKQIHEELENKISKIAKQQPVQFDQIAGLIQSYLTPSKNSQDQQEYHIVAEQLYLLMSHYDLDSDPKLEDIFSVMRVLLDPYGRSVAEEVTLLKGLDGFADIEQNRMGFIKAMPECSAETLTLTQLLQLWRKHKLKSNDFKKRVDESHISPPSPTFTPVINKKSEQIASKKTEKVKSEIAAAHTVSCKDLTHYDLLYHQRLEKDIPKLRVQPQPSFKPQTNQSRDSSICSQDVIQRLYHIPAKTNRNFKKIQEEQELKLCTFKPKIQPTTPRTPSAPKEVTNFDKAVGRLAVARQRKKELQMAYETMGRVKNSSKNKSFNPPSMLERSEPKVILEIKIDEYRVQKVKLYGGEDPHLVASRFVRKNSLNQEMVEVVQELIREYAQKHILNQ